MAEPSPPDSERARTPVRLGAASAADHRPLIGLAVITVVGVVLRLAAIIGPGHSGDLGVLSGWAEGMARHGLAYYREHATASGPAANYPPLLYVLWPLGVAFDGEALRTAIRALSIPFDVGIGLVLFGMVRGEARRLGANEPSHVGLWAAGLYLLNPAAIVDGPFWGQVDGIAALPMVVAIWLITRHQLTAAAVFATLAGLVKPQFGIAALILLAILAIGLRSKGGLRAAVLAAVAASLTYAAVMLPLGVGFRTYVSLLRHTTDQFRYMSVNGFNLWLAVFGPRVPDREAFAIGLGLTAIAAGAALFLLRRRRDLTALLAVGALIALALYFLPTRVHERHLFGAIVLLAPLAALLPRLRWPYVALSLTFTATLLYVLGTEHPPGFPIPASLIPLAAWQIWLVTAALIAASLWIVAILIRATTSRARPISDGSIGSIAA